MKTFEQARKFIYRNARSLDLALWDYHFEGGNKETVLNALAWYQNKDGGFAHGLEPDLWSDYSSPLATSRAIELLKSIAFFDCSHEITQGILRYLEYTPFQNEKGWFLKIPANNESPHAIWWDYSKETEMGFYGERGYNPTATLAGFIIKTADQTSAIYQKAVLIIQEAIAKIVEDGNIEMHEVACFCSLLSFLEIAEGLDDKIDTDVLKTHLQIAIGNRIVLKKILVNGRIMSASHLSFSRTQRAYFT